MSYFQYENIPGIFPDPDLRSVYGQAPAGACSRPRVAFVTPGSFAIPSANSSSVEHVVCELARALQVHADCAVFGRRTRGCARSEIMDGVRYLRPAAYKGSYLAGVINSLRKEQFDIIQVDNRPSFIPAVKRAFPRKTVWLSLHSTTFVSPRHISSRKLAACFRSADLIWANSEYLRGRLAAMVPSAAHKIHVNYLGANLGQFRSRWLDEEAAARRRQLERMGLKDNKIILYVGRLMHMKGIHHLLKAMPRVMARIPEARLMIVGGAFYGSARETPYTRMLRRLASRVPGKVHFVPYVPHDRIQEWFRLADVVAVPSAGREAFGLVNVEAMASGVPVVATRAGGMKEIVLHGETGFLAEPYRVVEELADRLTEVLADEALKQSMGEAGMRRVRELFTWQAAAARWMNRYRPGSAVFYDGAGSGWTSV